MKNIKILILILFAISNFTIFAEQDSVNQSKLSFELVPAISNNLSSQLDIDGIEYDNSGVALNARILIRTKKKLSIGIETGWLPIKNINNQTISNQFGQTNVKANLDAVPILIAFSWEFYNFALNYGIGYYYMISRIQAFNQSSFSGDFDFGFTFSLAYNYNFSDDFSLGAECKINQISDFSRTIITTGLNFKYMLVDF